MSEAIPEYIFVHFGCTGHVGLPTATQIRKQVKSSGKFKIYLKCVSRDANPQNPKIIALKEALGVQNMIGSSDSSVGEGANAPDPYFRWSLHEFKFPELPTVKWEKQTGIDEPEHPLSVFNMQNMVEKRIFGDEKDADIAKVLTELKTLIEGAHTVISTVGGPGQEVDWQQRILFNQIQSILDAQNAGGSGTKSTGIRFIPSVFVPCTGANYLKLAERPLDSDGTPIPKSESDPYLQSLVESKLVPFPVCARKCQFNRDVRRTAKDVDSLSYLVLFCGHFLDRGSTFGPEMSLWNRETKTLGYFADDSNTPSSDAAAGPGDTGPTRVCPALIDFISTREVGRCTAALLLAGLDSGSEIRNKDLHLAGDRRRYDEIKGAIEGSGVGKTKLSGGVTLEKLGSTEDLWQSTTNSTGVPSRVMHCLFSGNCGGIGVTDFDSEDLDESGKPKTNLGNIKEDTERILKEIGAKRSSTGVYPTLEEWIDTKEGIQEVWGE